MIGIDEVGRGSWAGPLLVVAARQMTDLPLYLADSKILTGKVRESLVQPIKQSCQLGEGWVQPDEIDRLGLTEAMRLGVRRALLDLRASNDEPIIMDGNINYCPPRFKAVTCIIDADASQPIVSAASIYAKVQRDQLMANLALEYPGYGFETNVGYGTKTHMLGLRSLGPCILHRKSYKPGQVFL